MKQLSLYWKNVTDTVIGSQHGVSLDQLRSLEPRIQEITAKMDAQRSAGKLRYRDLPYDKAMLKGVVALAKKYAPVCDQLVVLGIGGSALGNIALQAALNSPTHNLDKKRRGPQLFVLDNVDPELVRAVADRVAANPRKTIINVISKSGETAETASQFMFFRDLLQAKLGKSFARHIVATTDPREGTLRRIAEADGYDMLEVPDGVGGRFSVLSHVGLFSAAMCGINAGKILAGAADMDARLKKSKGLLDNPAAMIAAVHYLLSQRGKNISVMMPYSSSLYLLADWYRQLWAESIGKRVNLKGEEVFAGQTPVKALGTTDQHSQVQLYREGPNDKVLTLIQVEKFRQALKLPVAFKNDPAMNYLCKKDLATLLNAEKLGTEYALAESKRPVLSLVFPEISEATVGQFLYLYEVATSYMGELLGINTYDQPAVQLGKDATYALMGKPGFAELAAKIKPFAKPDSSFVI